MTIKVETLQAGEVLHDVHSRRMGNTTVRCEGHWKVYVREVGVDEKGPWAVLSWDGNPGRRHRSVPSGYKRHPKEWIRSGLGKRRCGLCRGYEDTGHDPTCKHPRAVRARKAASKEHL